jgi:hypothetical protein
LKRNNPQTQAIEPFPRNNALQARRRVFIRNPIPSKAVSGVCGLLTALTVVNLMMVEKVRV